jgi:hypothetical protein
MNTVGVVVLGASALMLATLPFARAENPKVLNTRQTVATQSLGGNAEGTVPQSHPLFTVGGVEVHLWTPVAPPYDSHANRNFAANPLWEAGTGPYQYTGW